MYYIYSLSPAPWGDDYRFVEAFNTKEDAILVLEVLEKVNIDFNLYKIIERSKWVIIKNALIVIM